MEVVDIDSMNPFPFYRTKHPVYSATDFVPDEHISYVSRYCRLELQSFQLIK